MAIIFVKLDIEVENYYDKGIKDIVL